VRPPSISKVPAQLNDAPITRQPDTGRPESTIEEPPSVVTFTPDPISPLPKSPPVENMLPSPKAIRQPADRGAVPRLNMSGSNGGPNKPVTLRPGSAPENLTPGTALKISAEKKRSPARPSTVEPRPRIARVTPPMTPKSMDRPRRVRSIAKDQPVYQQKISARPKPLAPRSKPAKERSSPPPQDLLASVRVEDFVHLKPNAPEPQRKPSTATELLSSVSVPMNGPPRPQEKAKPRKKARLTPLMTQDIRYRGYRYAVWKRIDERLYYPESVAADKVRAKVIVRFEVTRDGRLATLRIVQSSGFELFDEEALMAIRKAAPFPKFPPAISGNRLAIKSEILYEP
jgi:protein TonB